MSFTADLLEGRAIRDSVECLEGAYVPENVFGVLRFALDVSSVPFSDLEDLFDAFYSIDYEAEIAVQDELVNDQFLKVIKFERFITADLLPMFRIVIDHYCNSSFQAKLLYFNFNND